MSPERLNLPCAHVIKWASGRAAACDSSQNHRLRPPPGVTPQKRPKGQENYKVGGAPFFTHVPSWQNRFWGGGLPQFGAGDLSPVVPLSEEYNYLSLVLHKVLTIKESINFKKVNYNFIRSSDIYLQKQNTFFHQFL